MTRPWTEIPTDRPGDTIASCPHQHMHVHGTRAAYHGCDCRCTQCKAAAARASVTYEKDVRVSKPTEAPPARLAVDPATARAAGIVVVRHAHDDQDARQLLDTLGIPHMLKEVS